MSIVLHFFCYPLATLTTYGREDTRIEIAFVGRTLHFMFLLMSFHELELNESNKATKVSK